MMFSKLLSGAFGRGSYENFSIAVECFSRRNQPEHAIARPVITPGGSVSGRKERLDETAWTEAAALGRTFHLEAIKWKFRSVRTVRVERSDEVFVAVHDSIDGSGSH